MYILAILAMTVAAVVMPSGRQLYEAGLTRTRGRGFALAAVPMILAYACGVIVGAIVF